MLAAVVAAAVAGDAGVPAAIVPESLPAAVVVRKETGPAPKELAVVAVVVAGSLTGRRRRCPLRPG